MQILGLRTFIPTKDFDTSKAFYQELGFQIKWENEELAIVGVASYEFFIQKYYVKDWAENFMLQLFIDDIEGFYSVCERVIPKYDGTKLRPIFEAEYGFTFHVIDPAGVLWHITQRTSDEDIDANKLLCETQ